MSATVQLAIAQLNPTVGDLAGNTQLVFDAADAHRGAAALVCPEMCLVGYPAGDLALDTQFAHAARNATFELAAHLDEAGLGHMAVLVGCIWPTDAPEVAHLARDGGRPAAQRRPAANVAAVLRAGTVESVVAKHLLDDDMVLDDARTFASGPLPTPGCTPAVLLLASDGTSVRAGVAICEDLWAPGLLQGWAAIGIDVLLVLNASPWHRGQRVQRDRVAADAARSLGCPVVYANLVGGQDELVFDGASFALDSNGTAIARFEPFEPGSAVLEVPLPAQPHPPEQVRAPAPPARLPLPAVDDEAELEATWAALVLATRDYVTKNGFAHAVLGLSGGLDSAVVAAVAVDALGPTAVSGVAMPGPYSSPGSITDAEDLADRLGVELRVLDIGEPYTAMGDLLGVGAPAGDPRPFAGRGFDVAEENLQARLRGMTLMAIANKGVAGADGAPQPTLVLTTSNQSEAAVGYSTLYGDAAGGFAPIVSCPKTLVFALAEWRNRNRVHPPHPDAPIPLSTIAKPPSAELAPDQIDDQSLPPYPLLDAILDAHISDRCGPTEVLARLQHSAAAEGWDAEDLRATVERVCALVRAAEHKRRQSPPGPLVQPLSFGRSRRWPITNAWRPHTARR